MQFSQDIFRLSQIFSLFRKYSRSPFPPEVFLDAGSHGGHEVVEVHDDVNAHIEEPAEGGVAATNKPANGWMLI